MIKTTLAATAMLVGLASTAWATDPVPVYEWHEDSGTLTATYEIPAGDSRFAVVNAAVDLANMPPCHYNPTICQENGVDPDELEFYSVSGTPNPSNTNSNGYFTVTWKKK